MDVAGIERSNKSIVEAIFIGWSSVCMMEREATTKPSQSDKTADAAIIFAVLSLPPKNPILR